ncbi:AAA family ATPase [uncultured Fibrella sp.]|uniref:AAA family ATPase n=1 Tax=uncultured Fibrella sp. TaxID=1284596 RepID=UPI0035C9D763
MLKRVSIQNFKSLKDVTLDLQKVNLLIGPNNSGKSNFLKALEYMTKLNANTVELDYKNLVFSKDELYEIKIELVEESKLLNHERYFLCTINDNLTVHKQRGTQMNDGIVYSDPSTYDVNHTINFIGNLIIYKPDPNKIIAPGPVGIGQEFVNSDASNLVGFLDLLLGKYRKSNFQRIEADLKTCLPEFSEINLEDYQLTENIDEKIVGKSFKRIGLSAVDRGTIYWADELSEGTLYFLALLCIINQPNPPKLLLLEEPEKGIHPRRIWEVMKFIFQLAEEKDIQIILTTHNEHVVNAFSSIPEAVFVFDKDEEGATHVRNLQRDIIDVSNKKSEENGFDPIDFTSDLGKSWLYGLIGGVPEENI